MSLLASCRFLILVLPVLLATACGRIGFELTGDPESGEEDHANGDADADTEVESLPASGDWVLIDVSSTPFEMGSPMEDPQRSDDEVQHFVELTRHFWIQTTEVTQTQYVEMIGENPSRFTECGEDCPVEQVSWYMAAAYCNALSEAEEPGGSLNCYECSGSGPSVVCQPSAAFTSPYECPGYRLPTEAEWEYAARSGTTTPRYGDLNDVAWYSGNSGETTHEVATKDSSDWELYDMLGNVTEWVHDLWASYPEEAVVDPWGPADGTSNRVVRGGSWYVDSRGTRAANRYGWGPTHTRDGLGFRPARTAE